MMVDKVAIPTIKNALLFVFILTKLTHLKVVSWIPPFLRVCMDVRCNQERIQKILVGGMQF